MVHDGHGLQEVPCVGQELGLLDVRLHVIWDPHCVGVTDDIHQLMPERRRAAYPAPKAFRAIWSCGVGLEACGAANRNAMSKSRWVTLGSDSKARCCISYDLWLRARHARKDWQALV